MPRRNKSILTASRQLTSSKQSTSRSTPTPLGAAGFDNSRENIDSRIVTKTALMKQGRVNETPIVDTDIANKKYVDDSVPTNPVTSAAVLTANYVVLGNDGARDVKVAVPTAAQIATNTAHSADNTQAHTDYLLNSAADAGVGLTLSQDNSSADTAYVPMIAYDSDDSPPAASGYPVGTLFVTYTP